MEIAVIDEYRGKCLKLNFVVMFKLSQAEKLSTVYNIDNLAEARFKFVCASTGGWKTGMSISLKKHALAKDSIVKANVNCDIAHGSPPSQQWLCTENWLDWEEIKRLDVQYVTDSYYYRTFTVTVTVVKEKSFKAEKIYEDVDLTDFKLCTTDGSVSVHKAWLSAHSDVFKAMLCKEWKESAEGHVKIAGVTLQTLQHLKQYMYLSTLPDDGLRSLLVLANYYLMDELKSECISKLARTTSAENQDDLLNFAMDNNMPELAFAILELTPHDIVHGAYQLREAKAVSEKEF